MNGIARIGYIIDVLVILSQFAPFLTALCAQTFLHLLRQGAGSTACDSPDCTTAAEQAGGELELLSVWWELWCGSFVVWVATYTARKFNTARSVSCGWRRMPPVNLTTFAILSLRVV